jgi:hypothetical protein
MKHGCHPIIFSRGGIVGEPALTEVLRDGHLVGAAVFALVQHRNARRCCNRSWSRLIKRRMPRFIP